MELKKRNLPVSGSKPQLIERIRIADAAAAAAGNNNSVSNASSADGSQAGHPMDIPVDIPMDIPNTCSEDSMTGNNYLFYFYFEIDR